MNLSGFYGLVIRLVLNQKYHQKTISKAGLSLQFSMFLGFFRHIKIRLRQGMFEDERIQRIPRRLFFEPIYYIHRTQRQCRIARRN